MIGPWFIVRELGGVPLKEKKKLKKNCLPTDTPFQNHVTWDKQFFFSQARPKKTLTSVLQPSLKVRDLPEQRAFHHLMILHLVHRYHHLMIHINQWKKNNVKIKIGSNRRQKSQVGYRKVPHSMKLYETLWRRRRQPRWRTVNNGLLVRLPYIEDSNILFWFFFRVVIARHHGV